jgi:hypothetical protein
MTDETVQEVGRKRKSPNMITLIILADDVLIWSEKRKLKRK